jgi:hypothetical protein
MLNNCRLERGAIRSGPPRVIEGEARDVAGAGEGCQATSGNDPRIASAKMLPDKFLVLVGASPPNQLGVVHGGEDQHAREMRGRIGGCGALPSGRPK